MEKNIALIGNSDLAKAFSKTYSHYNYTWFVRPDYDITEKDDCDKLIKNLQHKDVVLITSGAINSDIWQSMLTNAVGPIYLVSELVKLDCQPHVIVVGSLGAEWRSWPGINLERLIYNNSKHMLSNFVKDFYHSQLNNCKLTVLEPGRFQSTMSDFTGAEIDNIVHMINYAIEASEDFTILNVQGAWHKRG